MIPSTGDGRTAAYTCKGSEDESGAVMAPSCPQFEPDMDPDERADTFYLARDEESEDEDGE